MSRIINAAVLEQRRAEHDRPASRTGEQGWIWCIVRDGGRARGTMRQQTPHTAEICSGISSADIAPVNHANESTVPREHILCVQIAMQPDTVLCAWREALSTDGVTTSDA